MVVLSILLFFVVTFLSIALAVVIAWMTLQKIAGQRAGGPAFESVLDTFESGSQLFKQEALSTISVWDSLLAKFDFVNLMKARIAEADLNWSVGRLTSLMLLTGTVMLALTANVAWVPVWAALIVSGLAVAAPYLYVLRRRAKRFQRFQEFFPDALDSMTRALRAGYPMAAALDVVATETPEPVATEMRKTFVEANLGMPWERALANLSERVPLLEVSLFSAAVQLHARTGGRLSEVIGGLAESMRESVALQGEVRSLAAHGRLTGWVLTVVPVAILGLMAYVSPSYVHVLLDYRYGTDLIAAAVICLVLAQLVIRKIVDIRL
jgi:tight adherence protein B